MKKINIANTGSMAKATLVAVATTLAFPYSYRTLYAVASYALNWTGLNLRQTGTKWKPKWV
jgi:hypothetical protein